MVSALTAPKSSRWGHGSGGVAGMNLQNAPTVGPSSSAPVQPYLTRLPGAVWPLRSLTSTSPSQNVTGSAVGYQAGNPAIRRWDLRAKTPSGDSLTGPPEYSQPGNAMQPGNPYGGDPRGKPDVRMPFQEDDQLGGFQLANEKLVTRDRHVFFKVGYENSGRGSGQTDPPMDGPPRPALATINRTINWQQGTVYGVNGNVNSLNGNADDLSRPYATDPTTKAWLGEQGSGWTPVNGGVPGLYQPYGSYSGYTTGPVQGIQSPVEQGQPGDGPRKVFSGPPHGLHSPTLPDYSPILGWYLSLPAQRAPRQDRPDNSTIAGQSYSQTVQPQGQTGTVALHSVLGVATAATQRYRFTPGTGWRGMTGTISPGGGYQG